MNNFIIPNALQIVVDDLGWMNGKDDRENGGPSRTGMPRKHCAEDYAAINELGKTIGMKINCAFVIGEWDPDNRLGKIPYFSKYGENWDNAKYLDRAELARMVEVINASEYIDISIHGLMHGSQKPGIDNNDSSDFFYMKNGAKYTFAEKELREKLDAFFGLLNFYGVKKEVNSYTPSAALYVPDTLSRILPEYGVKYIIQPFCATQNFAESNPFLVTMDNGIIVTDRCNFIKKEGFTRTMDIRPWDEVASDFPALPKATCMVGTHWPNYLHLDPKRSLELTAHTAEYFKSCADVFGSMMSRDLGFYSTQALYKRFAKTEEKDGVFTVDVSTVSKPIGTLGKFYISAKNPVKNHSGCEISLYETKETHLTYEIIPTADIITIS